MLQTAQNELENEPYIHGKLRMSTFWSNLRIINIIFLEEVMGIVTLKGSETWTTHTQRERQGMDSLTWAENGWIVG